MKHIFIDLGCYDGDTILQFRNWRHLHYPVETEWLMYGFDANPGFKKEWERHERHDTVFTNKAAWTYDGHIEYSQNPNAISSTVMKEKKGYTDGDILTIECFDFSEWLRQFKDDHVILKMDIEGAELPVLTKMIEDGTDDIAYLTMVEWHDGKMPTYKSNKHIILDKYRGRLVEWR